MNDELITGVQSPASGQIRIKASELRHPGTFGVPSTYAEEGTFPLGARTGNDQPTTFAIVDYAANEPGRHLSQNTPSAKPPPLKRHHLEPLRGRSANVHLAQLATALATQPESPASISTVSAASPASSLMNNTSLQERSDESQLEGLSDFGQINRFSEIDQEFHMPATWRASASSTMTDESWHWSERSTAAFLGFATGILVIVPTVMLLSTEPSWIKFSSLLSSGNSSIPQLLDEHKGAEETSPNLPDHAAIRVRSASHPSTEQPALKPQHAGEIATASAMPSGIWYDSTEPAEKSASPDLTSRQLPTAESPALQPALASDQTGVPASSTAQPSAAAVPITESELWPAPPSPPVTSQKHARFYVRPLPRAARNYGSCLPKPTILHRTDQSRINKPTTVVRRPQPISNLPATIISRPSRMASAPHPSNWRHLKIRPPIEAK